MATRRRAREVALQLLFQQEGNDCSPEYSVQLYKNCFGEGPLPDSFSIELFTTVVGDLDRIDKVIERSSENWRLDRMSRVDRNILRIGVHEILADENVPVRVAINEAVELAKRFGTEESASFVNGILDRIARDESRL